MFREILSRLGVQFGIEIDWTPVATLKDAARVAGMFDLIVLDLGLEDAAPEATLAALRANWREWPPVVVATAHREHEHNRFSIIQYDGADALLDKWLAMSDPLRVLITMAEAVARRRRDKAAKLEEEKPA